MGTYTPAHYYEGREKTIRLIVIHTMEAPEGPQTAENIASYFASGAVVASAHACVDQDSVVVCLPPTATAFAAPGANADGYQIEHAGFASQDGAGWADAASQSMLRLSAAHAREIAVAAGIPLRHLTDDELAAGYAGFVGHDQVSRVYKRSDHWDPGPAFPWDQYMSLVNNGEDTTEETPLVQEEDDMHFVRSRQTGTIYSVTPTDVCVVGDAKTWGDLVKAYGLTNEYEVSLDDGDIAGLAADAAARRARLVAEVAATVGAIDPAKLAESLAPAIVPPLLSALTLAGAAGLTPQQVRDAAEQAVRSVFANAAKEG
ncbi:peptidoglycan recognition protein family protein [Kytococcus sedentarius]|uniref:peptidoglycan recognition protein family protein n=1 Tax=Kytococcus sedentarius TaxID=1276 RepID=UPI00065FE512|nr:N-acetylmuramoyl-L-alanine amidase [Kytococcus sedentarius]